MRFNRKRHLLLRKLSEKFLSEVDNPSPKLNADIVGLTLIEIESLLKVRKAERELILSELDKNQEIEIFDLKGSKGFVINDKYGLAAFASKKYKKMNEDIIINWFKVFVQIAVPILSLVITILVILKDDSKTAKEIETIEQTIESLQNNIKSMELNQQTLPNHKIDSI